MQPLSGILVLDFTTLLPGPLATLMLAEAGAEVIKIERPEGEDMRAGVPRFDGEAAAFALLNRGKKGITLDLKNESDRNRLRPLLEKADVLVEQFRPGVMNRLKLGFDDVRKINPRIVYCSISGYGQHGPRSGDAGHDINYQSLTGSLAVQPGPIEKPVIPPALIADIGGGTSDFSLVRVGPERAARLERKDDILANHGVHVAGTDFDRRIELLSVPGTLARSSCV